MHRIIILVALACMLPGPELAPSAAAAEKLTVAAGAGYKKMVAELAQAFTAESGIEVEQIHGNMGQVISQAKNSGLVDCLIGDKSFLDQSDRLLGHSRGRPGQADGRFCQRFGTEEPLGNPAGGHHACGHPRS